MRGTKILYSGLKQLNSHLQKEEWDDAKFLILLDENTFNHCLPLLLTKVERLQQSEFMEIPIGKEAKDIAIAEQIWASMLEDQKDKKTVIVNLGGGSVSDLGGFVASLYKRGIRYINIPTTLLSMVDAAIGGKTAIDFGGIKNSIGTVYMPSLVCIDQIFLDSLNEEEKLNGEFEMVKTAAVLDGGLYNRLLNQQQIEKKDIEEVAKLKSIVVKKDANDHGIRHILNFGHTFGHAVEKYIGCTHGVAVGLGMSVAMYLSVKKLGLSKEVYNTYSMWINSKIELPQFGLKDIEAMITLMKNDKKATLDNIRAVLLKELGAAVINVDIDDNEVRDAFLRLGQPIE